MEINGKVHCFFEQSGTFKNEFKKLGYDAFDYDIQNNFNETDFNIDLFNEIEKAYAGGGMTLFDAITNNDLILAFFPCIYFCALSQIAFNFGCINYRTLSDLEKMTKIIERARNREKFYSVLLKFVAVCLSKNIRMIFENPYSEQTYLKSNFVKNPDVLDKDRTKRGDYFIKPTGYWYFNCEPTYGESFQFDKKQKNILDCKQGIKSGVCSEERSMISKDYARNFICDFILGKEQSFGQGMLF